MSHKLTDYLIKLDREQRARLAAYFLELVHKYGEDNDEAISNDLAINEPNLFAYLTNDEWKMN